jgi:branched-chain amino acid transport system substrate-binding protein
MISRKVVLSAVASAALLASASSYSADTIKFAFMDPLSGAFAATGSNGLNNFKFFADEVNRAGGVLGRQIEVIGFDNKVSPKESLIQLKSVVGEGIQFVFQGNSSGVANALTDAIKKHNEREPSKRLLYMNYSAVDPALTNEKCSFWHFRFDANADMKMNALTDVMAADKSLKSVYILGQDYSFGQAVAAGAVHFLGEKRPDIKIVGNELHPIGKVKDFSPYVAKIKASGADALITGNWGADMLGLAKAVEDAGLNIPIFTYYAAGSGITKAIGMGGVGRVRVVAEGTVNPPLTDEWADVMTRFKKEYPDGNVDQARISNAVRMTVAAIKKAGTTDSVKVAQALEGMTFKTYWGDTVSMRASDHQIQLPVRIMAHTNKDVKFDFDNSGFGLVNETAVTAANVSTPTTCKMERPS